MGKATIHRFQDYVRTTDGNVVSVNQLPPYAPGYAGRMHAIHGQNTPGVNGDITELVEESAMVLGEHPRRGA